MFDSEVIVGRGRRKTHHLVRLEDAWVVVSEHPSARSERIDAGPGTVWESRVELSLPRGTRMVRVVSQPLEEPPRDPLAYLTRPSSTPKRRTIRTELVVGVRGTLEEVPPGSGRDRGSGPHSG